MGLQQEEARHCAFIQAMDKAGLQPRIIAVPADDRGTARLAVKSAIRAGEPLDALFCYNDDFALAARAAVEECGLSVPHDVAIVGYDGLPEGEYMTPPLSTVLVPAGDIARLAWELLQRRMEEPAAAVRCEVIEPRLIVRASSKTP